MKVGDLVRIKNPTPLRGRTKTKSLWAGSLALIVRKIPFYEMQGKVSDPYQPWYEVLLCEDGRLKTFREDYLWNSK